MILKKYTKQPSEDKDYDIGYSTWLSPMGDTIDDVIVSVTCLDDPLDTSLEVYLVQNTTSTVKLWIRGGTDGYVYKIDIQVRSVGKRTDESELIFAVGEV
jgi:hypothetical protein